MLGFAIRKLLRAMLTLLLVVGFVFVVLRASGDPADTLLPDDAPQEVRDAYRARWGLDAPLGVQFLRYITGLAQGDLGTSFLNREPVAEMVARHLGPTLRLGGAALGLALLIGVPLGLLAALRHDTLVDRLAMGVAVVGYALPNFFFAILLLLVFVLHWRVLPAGGAGTAAHMIMPMLTLGTAVAGVFARFTRSAMLEVLGQTYMRTARAKGIGRVREYGGHALPNAMVPLVTVFGFQLGALVAGALVTETVFAWPGIGRLLITSVANRDLPVVQALVLLFALSMVVVNTLVDITYGWIDPRIREREATP